MSITYHERPGVYSDYDASAVTASARGSKIVAVAGLCTTAEEGLYTITSYAAAAAKFGEDCQLTQMLKLLYLNGAGTVLASPVTTNNYTDYAIAAELALTERRASYLVVGCNQATAQGNLRNTLEYLAARKGECIFLAGMSQATVDQLIGRAKILNSERIVLVGPDAYLTDGTRVDGCVAAAALAGVLAAQTDPALPLNGATLNGLSGVTEAWEDEELDQLITAGVTPLEASGGSVSVVRGVTTRATTAGAADPTWRELNTILIVDEVIPAIREALQAKFARSKNNATTRAAIRNAVVVELEDRIRREIIDGYENLTVEPDSSDPTVCDVSFQFTVTHGLNRILLTAHINV